MATPENPDRAKELSKKLKGITGAVTELCKEVDEKAYRAESAASLLRKISKDTGGVFVSIYAPQLGDGLRNADNPKTILLSRVLQLIADDIEK